MGILDSIKNYVYDKIGKVNFNEANEAIANKLNSQAQNIQLVAPENVGKNEDSFKASQNAKTNGALVTNEQTTTVKHDRKKHKPTVGESRQNYEASCRKEGFDPQKVIKKIMDDLKPESEDEQILAIECAEFTIKMVKRLENEGKISSRKDKSEVGKFLAKLAYQAMSTGLYSSFEELEKDYYEKFQGINQNEKMSIAEQIVILKKDINLAKQKELQDVNKLPANERENAIMQIEEKYKALENGIFQMLAVDLKTEEAVDYLAMGNVDSLDENIQMLIETNASVEDKQKAADSITSEKTLQIISEYNNQGTPVKADVLEKATKIHISYKTEDAMYQYQQSMVNSRDMYETAKAKKANGEALTPEEEALLNIMQDEYYTNISQGIGEGAIENRYMSNDAKAEFLAKWDNDAKKYDDYDQVTQSVNKELAKNPILNEKVEIAKDNIKAMQETIKDIKKLDKASEKRVIEETIKFDIKNNESEKLTTSVMKKSIKENKNVNIVNKDVNEAQILKLVQDGTVKKYSDLRKICKSSIVLTKIILSNDELEVYIPELIQQLKSISKDALMYILRGMSETNIMKIAEELELTSEEIEEMTNRKLSYDIKKIMEVNENENHYV